MKYKDAEKLRQALAARPRQSAAKLGLRPAAVLVGIIVRDQPHLLFTQRSEELRAHSGQISFPGGKQDPDDRDLVHTALREAEEELALPQSDVEVLGKLDDVFTPSGYCITPIVGRITTPPSDYVLSGEVAEAFEVGLPHIADPNVYREEGTYPAFGREYTLVAYHVAGKRIWGATARMVYNLLEVLGDPKQL